MPPPLDVDHGPLCVLSSSSFCSETSSNGLVEFASMPTRGNPDVERDDARIRHQKTSSGAGIKPLSRNGFRFVDLTT
jgi:hypothetical protein